MPGVRHGHARSRAVSRTMVRAGRIGGDDGKPGRGVGDVRIRRSEIDAYLERNRREPDALIDQILESLVNDVEREPGPRGVEVVGRVLPHETVEMVFAEDEYVIETVAAYGTRARSQIAFARGAR